MGDGSLIDDDTGDAALLSGGLGNASLKRLSDTMRNHAIGAAARETVYGVGVNVLDFSSTNGYDSYVSMIFDTYFASIAADMRNEFVLYFFGDSTTMLSYGKMCMAKSTDGGAGIASDYAIDDSVYATKQTYRVVVDNERLNVDAASTKWHRNSCYVRPVIHGSNKLLLDKRFHRIVYHISRNADDDDEDDDDEDDDDNGTGGSARKRRRKSTNNDDVGTPEATPNGDVEPPVSALSAYANMHVKHLFLDKEDRQSITCNAFFGSQAIAIVLDVYSVPVATSILKDDESPQKTMLWRLRFIQDVMINQTRSTRRCRANLGDSIAASSVGHAITHSISPAQFRTCRNDGCGKFGYQYGESMFAPNGVTVYYPFTSPWLPTNRSIVVHNTQMANMRTSAIYPDSLIVDASTAAADDAAGDETKSTAQRLAVIRNVDAQVRAFRSATLMDLSIILDLRDSIFNADKMTTQIELVVDFEKNGKANANIGGGRYAANMKADKMNTMKNSSILKNHRIKSNGCALGHTDLHFVQILLAHSQSDPALFKSRVIEPSIYAILVNSDNGELTLPQRGQRLRTPWRKKTTLTVTAAESNRWIIAQGSAEDAADIIDPYACEYCKHPFYDDRDVLDSKFCYCYIILRAVGVLTKRKMGESGGNQMTLDQIYSDNFAELHRDPFAGDKTSYQMVSPFRIVSKSTIGPFGGVEVIDPNRRDAFSRIKRSGVAGGSDMDVGGASRHTEIATDAVDGQQQQFKPEVGGGDASGGDMAGGDNSSRFRESISANELIQHVQMALPSILVHDRFVYTSPISEANNSTHDAEMLAASTSNDHDDSPNAALMAKITNAAQYPTDTAKRMRPPLIT